MLPEGFRQALKRIHSRLKDREIDWAVIGSTNLAIHGMDVQPNDIDVITGRENIPEIQKIFSDYMVGSVRKKKSGGDKPLKFSEIKLNIRGVEVQIIGEDEEDVYFSKIREGRAEKVEVNGIDIPCATLEADADAYEEIGRVEKAERIRDYLGKL